MADLSREKINKIFEILDQNIKNPTTELNFKNEFTLLIAIILSARTTDVLVNKVCEPIFEIYNTPKQFLELGEEEFSKKISSIGLYKTKTKNIMKTCEILINNYGSKVPSNFEQLIELPGVGRKTANVFLNCAHGASVIGVDTHVLRTSFRLGIVNSQNAAIVERQLMQAIDECWLQKAANLLVLHGRYTCKAKNPKCEICPISQYCIYYNK